MHLIGKFNKRAFKVNLSSKEEYQRLRQESLLEQLPVMSLAEPTLTISLLNTRSLEKNTADILKDKNLLSNDILFNRNTIAV